VLGGVGGVVIPVGGVGLVDGDAPPVPEGLGCGDGLGEHGAPTVALAAALALPPPPRPLTAETLPAGNGVPLADVVVGVPVGLPVSVGEDEGLADWLGDGEREG